MKRKKSKRKNFLKIGILLFGILILITNCDKGELFVNEIEQNNPFTLKKLIQKEYANNSNLNKVLENFNSSNFKSRNSEKTNLNVDTSQSNYLESTDGAFHSYSFAIIDLDSDLIKNLVISLQPDNTYKTFLVTYNLTDTDKEIIYQEIDANASDYLNRTLTCTTTLSYTCTQTQTNTYCTDCDNPSTANTITVTECVAYSVNSQTTCTQNNGDLLNGSDELIYGDSGGSGGNFIWANGSSSSGYTNGGSMIMLSLPSPCDKMNELADDDLFKTYLSSLKTFASSTDPNANREIAYTRTNDGDYSDIFIGGLNSDHIDVAVPNPINIHMHTHQPQALFPNSLPVYSAADLYTIYWLLDTNKVTDFRDFALTLVTESTTYAIRIKSKTAFLAAFQNYFSIPNDTDAELGIKFLEKRMKEKYKIDPAKSDSHNETQFVKMLENLNKSNGGTGLVLFKANADYSNWNELATDKFGEVSPKDCDE